MNLTIREFFERYGPTMAIIAVLALMMGLLPGNTSDDAAVSTGGQAATTGGTAGGATSGTVATGPAGGAGGVAASTGSGGGTNFGVVDPNADPLTVNALPQAAEGASSAWGPEHGPGNYPAPGPDTACREDGAMPDFSFYSPQCLPLFTGDNGGATEQGVTADEVVIVRYVPQPNPATQATLRAIGADDSPEVETRAAESLFRFFNLHYETYGRELKYVEFHGTGDAQTDEVNRADAVTIATQLKPFVVFHNEMAATTVFAQELGARGVPCVCTTSFARKIYEDHSPYIWTILPVLEEYYESMAEYWGKRLKGGAAKHAGTNLRVSNDKRTFGLVYIEGTGTIIDPNAKAAAKHFEAELGKYGVKLAKSVSYTFDIAQQQQQSTNIIGQMVSAGVNVIACVCDPLYPIFLTSEASKQQWFPEWFITGTSLIDTTFFGRTYDAQQWAHAYGMSPLWVFFDDVSESYGYRTYHHMNPGAARGDEGVGINVWHAPMQLTFIGVHYAGPKLTHETWSEGLFVAPPRGGTPNAPLVKFTRENMGAIKDWTEVWWSSNGTGKDETGKDGAGILMKASGGARYTAGNWPQAAPYVFGDDPQPTFRLDHLVQSYDHDADGHTHENDTRACRSCT
jgi:hypothetical protein